RRRRHALVPGRAAGARGMLPGRGEPFIGDVTGGTPSMIRTTFISLAMLVLACAEGSASSGSASSDFQPTGGIVVASGTGARFNATQVNGPKVHRSQRSDGTWGGPLIAGGPTPTPIDATFQGGQFVGSNIRLSITREGGQTTIVGSVLDRIVRFEVTATEIR